MSSLHRNPIVKDLFSINYLFSQKQKMETIVKELNKHYLLSAGDLSVFKTMVPTYENNSGGRIIALVGNLQHIEVFHHPLYHDGKVFIDARPFTNKLGDIKDQNDYDFMVRRAILIKLWMENQNVFFTPDMINLVAKVFSDWISNVMDSKLGVDLRVVTNIKIILLAYILSLSVSSSHMDESEIEALILKRSATVLRLPHEFTLGVLEMYPSVFEGIFNNPGRIYYLVSGLSALYGEKDSITESLLYSIIATGATMLPMSTQLTCISIEHLPTLVSLLYSVNVPSMKVTKLGAAVYNNRSQFGDTLDKFMAINTNYTHVDPR
jgi:hypothetical protein